ncbi:MAG: hypothetical protein IKE75_04060 [Bacilli bacterium]|nr:hypothetical protein [Bacilli bacterium]
MEHGSTVSFEEIKQELLKKTNWENKECEAYLSNQKWIIETLKEDLTVERTYHDYDYNETIKAGALVKRSTSRPNYEVYEITPERAKLGFVPVIEEGKEEPNLYQERIFVSKEPIGSEKSHVDNDVYPTYLVCRPGYYDDAFYSFEVPQPEIVEKFSLQRSLENQVIEYEEIDQPEIEYQDVVLTSANPEQYPDRVVRCRVIKREDIGSYLETIPDEDKCIGCKSEPVEARVGQVGERVLTTLKTTYEGKDYILSEVTNEVKDTEMEDGTKQPDMIVTNTHSTSNEEYIVRANKFPKMYSANTDGTFTPTPDPREVARLSEDVVIETSWGEMAVGLKGSYIVTYDAERQSYNTIEQGAFESTYTIQDGLNKQL